VRHGRPFDEVRDRKLGGWMYNRRDRRLRYRRLVVGPFPFHTFPKFPVVADVLLKGWK